MDYNRYPDIAFSDAINASSALYAAYSAYLRRDLTTFAPLNPAFLGFLLVGLAAAVGTLRFGWKPRWFARANEQLALIAGAIGTPLLPFALIRQHEWSAETVTLALIALHATARMFLARGQCELVTVLTNTVMLTVLCYQSYLRRYWLPIAASLVFVLAGIVIGPDRHRRILGSRRENLFHYALALTWYLFDRAALGTWWPIVKV